MLQNVSTFGMEAWDDNVYLRLRIFFKNNKLAVPYENQSDFSGTLFSSFCIRVVADAVEETRFLRFRTRSSKPYGKNVSEI